jgi:serpin B
MASLKNKRKKPSSSSILAPLGQSKKPNHCHELCTYQKTRDTHAKQWMMKCKTCFSEKAVSNNSNLVCLACASQCHNGHELYGLKLFNGYCDCGAEKKCRPIDGPGVMVYLPKRVGPVLAQQKADLDSDVDDDENNNNDNETINTATMSNGKKTKNTFIESAKSNQFSTQVLHSIQQQQKADNQKPNIKFIGGANLLECLMILYLGSSGVNQYQMSQLIQMSQQEAAAHLVSVWQDILYKSKQIQSNRWFFVNSKIQIRDSYEKTLQNVGVALDKGLDTKQPEVETKRINDQIAKATQGLVTDLIPKGAIQPLTQFIVVTTDYFRAQWKHPFEPAKLDPFYESDSKTRQELLMTQRKSKHLYYENDQFQFLQAAYDENEWAMGFILPSDHKYNVQKEPMPTNIPFEQFKEEKIKTLTIPKFKAKFVWTKAIPTFQKMGCTAMFQPGPHFDGITDAKDIFISLIAHQCTVDVSEKETVASAASAVMATRKCISRKKDDITFIANRPFYWYIVHRETKLIRWNGIYA